MKFESFDQLKEYTGKYLAQSDLEQLWGWVQKGMVTSDQVVSTTRECRSDEECMTASLKHNAWTAFIKNYSK